MIFIHNMTENKVKASSDPAVKKEYIATFSSDNSTMVTEVIILESLIHLDDSVKTPLLLVTDESEVGNIATRILVNCNQGEVIEVQRNNSKRDNRKTKVGSVEDSSSSNAVSNDGTTSTFNHHDPPIVPDNKNSQVSSNYKQRFLKCDFEGCCRTFLWPTHLKYHSLTHTGSRQFKCPFKVCNKRFYTQQRLNVHLRTHTGERPFICEADGCDRSFTTAGNLKNHMRVHTGERPFVCEILDCGKRFAELSSLKKHCLVHTGDKPFACQFCRRTFSQIGSRNVHQRKHHSNEHTIDETTSVSENMQSFGRDIINFHHEIELPKDEVNFDVIAEAIVIPASSSSDCLMNDDEQDTDKQSDPLDEITIQEPHVIETRSDRNLPHGILPNSNANVLVLAEPQSIPELGYRLPQSHIPEEIIYKTILP